MSKDDLVPNLLQNSIIAGPDSRKLFVLEEKSKKWIGKNITQKINLNYSSDVKFPINFKQKDNNVGIQLPLVANKYIAADLSKNSESNSSYQQYTRLISKTENLFGMQISEDQLKKMLQYLPVLTTVRCSQSVAKVTVA